jgi:predicted ATPase
MNRRRKATGTPPLGLTGGSAPRLGAGFLRWAEFELPEERRRFPFSLPAFQALERLEFHPAITFFIGENGSGKSTLLEALAVKAGFSSEGGWKKRPTESIEPSSELERYFRIARDGLFSDGWFLRAESFYNVATELQELDDEPLCGHGFAAYGGKSFHEQSHGEAFLALLNHRLSGDGLYLFDEPEAALSPQRQLAVLTLLHRLIRHHSQLVIATHSPILLAYPHAFIYEFSEAGIRRVTYEETETFRVTRDFLAQPERMIQLLLQDED